MPYIKQKDREDILINKSISDVGKLNFSISTICNIYLKSAGVSYSTVNDIIGVLECAKLEFYRRIASPYEDMKIEQNGDIY